MHVWSVEKVSGAPVVQASVVLLEHHGCGGHWKTCGADTDVAFGYAFSIASAAAPEHITIQMVPDGQLLLFPELCAMNGQQFRAWQRQKVTAEPVMMACKEVRVSGKW